jgi:glucose/arabinose dehydrogenase
VILHRNRVVAAGFGLLALFASYGIFVPNADAQAWKSAYSSPTSTGDCTGLDSALRTGFIVDTLVSRAKFGTGFARPMKMAFDLFDSSKPADIYITQKYGDIQYYNSTAKTLTNIGKVPGVWRAFEEDGLGGIALDPNFKTNGYIYVSYSYRYGLDSNTIDAAQQSNPSDTVGLRVSRFTLNTVTKMMDTSSKKLIIHIPAAMGSRYHTGGSLRFDKYGNLYISAGDNESLFMGPGNTADLRGGILRIIPGANGGYTIPDGNFGAYWGQKWEDSGLVNRAIKYYNTSKVRPEIYIKGSRNPYVFGLDPNIEGRIAWSECGPDNQRREEQNITDKPVFGGFPFWVGDTSRQYTFDNTYNELGDIVSSANYATYNPLAQSKTTPVNTWPGSSGYTMNGVDTLPPMHLTSAQWNGTGPNGLTTGNTCAMGGPIIRYDSRVAYTGKMPPHLNHTMLWGDYMGQRYWMMKIDSTTGKATGSVYEVFPAATYPRGTTLTQPTFGRHIDLQQSPDGALYLLNHGAGCCDGNTGGQSSYAGIIRIRYTGSCSDPSLMPAVTSTKRALRPGEPSWLKVRAGTLAIRTKGHHTVRILDLSGRQVTSFAGEGPREYAMPALSPGRVYIVQAVSPRGTLSQMLGRP